MDNMARDRNLERANRRKARYDYKLDKEYKEVCNAIEENATIKDKVYSFYGNSTINYNNFNYRMIGSAYSNKK